MVKESRIDNAITVHAWNADRTEVAVCPNNNTVVIFRKPTMADGAWERVATLAEHDALVTDIAWAPRTVRCAVRRTMRRERTAAVDVRAGGRPLNARVCRARGS